MIGKKYSIFSFLATLIITGVVFFGLTNSARAASSDSSLSDLSIDRGVLNPIFNTSTFNYTATTTYASINVIATTTDSLATIKVLGDSVSSGEAMYLNLSIGVNTVDVEVTAEDTSTSTYYIVITREPVSIPTTNYAKAGLSLFGIAFDGVNMWATNFNHNSVVKITSDGATTTYSGTGANPRGIAFDGVNMWTANHNGNSVTKISPEGVMTTYTGAGAGPEDIAFDGVNMWTANSDNDSVTKISPEGVMTTYTGAGDQPTGIAFDGTNMWTANYDGPSVTKISPEGVMTTYTGINEWPFDIAFDGVNMWTVNDTYSGVTKISPEGEITNYLGAGAYPYGIAFDGVNMWTTNYLDNSVTKVLPNGEMITYANTGAGPYGIAFDGVNYLEGITSGPGLNMWTVNDDDDSITKIAIRTDSTDSSLSNLSIDQGTLTPEFDLETLNYTASVANIVTSVNVTPTANDDGATIEVNGTPTDSESSAAVDLEVGENVIDVVITAEDGETISTYEIVVTREASSDDPFFTLLHSFLGEDGADGSYPQGSLILSGSTFYGMTYSGGDSSAGTIFSINTDGTGFNLLHEFSYGVDDGGEPNDSLILSGSKLYGMTEAGGDSEMGTIFSINTDGTDFTLLHEFTGGADGGSYPYGSLILSGSTFYGMTYSGGDSEMGTIFSINTDGTDFTLLHEFTGETNDGSYPQGSLILSNSTLYGMTSGGESLGYGTIFSIDTNGENFNLLHEFTGGADGGSYPQGSLILSNSTLYGMTSGGGSSGYYGTVFSRTLPLSSDSSLHALFIDQGTLTPIFNSETINYTASVTNDITSLNVTPTTTDEGATITVNDTTVNSGSATSIDLAVGENTISIVVTAKDDSTSTYTIVVTREAAAASVSGGSVISYAVNCASVVYGEWGDCVNGMQYRNYISQSPNGCVLIASQRLAANRACQTVTPTTSTPTAPASNILENIMSEAKILATEDTNQLLSHLGVGANIANEQAGLIKYKTILDLDKTISNDDRLTINDFIVYGTLSTKHLGAGERAAVINSYYQAYGKLPNSEAEWSDVLKIANGRWPSEHNIKTETQAKIEFKKVYDRNAVMTNNIDENAIMIIAYGLIPSPRNLASEQIAIKTFKWVYGHNPVNALAWNIVRAIAYSGARR